MHRCGRSADPGRAGVLPAPPCVRRVRHCGALPDNETAHRRWSTASPRGSTGGDSAEVRHRGGPDLPDRKIRAETELEHSWAGDVFSRSDPDRRRGCVAGGRAYPWGPHRHGRCFTLPTEHGPIAIKGVRTTTGMARTRMWAGWRSRIGGRILRQLRRRMNALPGAGHGSLMQSRSQ